MTPKLFFIFIHLAVSSNPADILNTATSFVFGSEVTFIPITFGLFSFALLLQNPKSI
jgi:hypothetical protein